MLDYYLGLYEKSMPSDLTLEEKLNCAKSAGYDYLELSIDETDEKLARLDMSQTDRENILTTVFKTGIPIRSICLSGHRRFPMGSKDSQVRKKSLEIMDKAINLAGELGIRLIQLAGYDVYYDKGDAHTRSLFIDSLQKAVDMASAAEVMLGFETMETPFMDTVEKAMYYVNLINSPYLSVYPDCGNITNSNLTYNSSVLDDIQCGKGHIAAFHLKESKPGIYREVPYGEGHVNFQQIINCAWHQGVRSFVAEFWYVKNDNWKEILEHNNNYLRNFFSFCINSGR